MENGHRQEAKVVGGSYSERMTHDRNCFHHCFHTANGGQLLVITGVINKMEETHICKLQKIQ